MIVYSLYTVQESFWRHTELLSALLTERLLPPEERIEYVRREFCGKSYVACRGMVRSGEEFVPAEHIVRMLGRPDMKTLRDISKDDAFLNLFTETVKNLGVKNPGAYFAKLGCAFNMSLSGDCNIYNFGFLRDPDTLKLKPAPLFDRGRSFGSFGAPIANGEISVAKYALESPKALFLIMIFHSVVLWPEWDYTWYDPARLDGFSSEIRRTLRDCANARYIELLQAGFEYQTEYLLSAAGTCST